MTTEFTPLTPAQTAESSWKRAIKPQIVLRLAEVREELERPNTLPERTASLRANISLLKELLALEADLAQARRQQVAMQNPDD